MGRRVKAESLSPSSDETGRSALPEISTANSTLGALLRQMPAVIWAIDRDLRFTLSEGGGLAALGAEPGDAVGRTLFEYFGTEDPEFPPIAAHRRALSGHPVTYETEWMGRSFYCHVEPLRDGEGEIIGAAGFAIDITEPMLAEQELRQSESKYRALVEQLPAIVYLGEYGEEGDWLYISPQIEQVLGYTPEEWLAHPHPMTSFTHPEDLPAARAEESRAQREGDTYRAEYRMRAKDGRWVWILDEATAVREASGTPFLMQGVMFDITEREQTEEELRRANRALRMISECNQALIRAPDEPSLLADVCEKIVEVGGYRLAWVGYAEQDPRKTVRPVAQAGFEEGYLDHLEITWADEAGGRGPTGTAIRTGQAVVARSIPEDPAFALWREEAARWGYSSSAAFPLQAGGECFGALNAYAAETDAFDEQEVGLLSELADDLAFGILATRARAELRETIDVLRKSDQQRRELLSRVVTAQEEERRSIASDIHDDTIQALTIVGLRLGVLRQRLADPEQLKALATLEGSVDSAIGRLRLLIFELRPPALDREGLSPALHEHLERVAAEAGFDYQIKNRLAAEPAPEVRVVIYRIAHEALANVRKHARAANVEIVLEPREEGVFARIRDDGAGFDAEKLQENCSEHVGLCNMREQAEMAGGWCRISSAVGAGTVVELWIPLK